MSATDTDTVPTNPSMVAAHSDFPSVELYRRILDRVGKVDADHIWAGAKVAAAKAHPSAVKS